MKKTLKLITALIFLATGISAAGKTATEIIDAAAATFSKAQSVSADFTISSGNGNKASGKLLLSGNMFVITMDEAASWFDGKNLWSYSKATSEINLSDPTQEEIAELNPLSYILAAKKSFHKRLLKSQDSSVEIVELTPEKGSRKDFNKVIVTIDAKTSLPKKITVYPAKSQPTVTITLTNVTKGKTLPVSSFRYKAGTIPGAEIIDLR